MIADEVIITAIFTGIISVLGLTFKNIKSSRCWSKESCCLCVSKSDTASINVINTPPIISSTNV
jgi:hypothetical protein